MKKLMLKKKSWISMFVIFSCMFFYYGCKGDEVRKSTIETARSAWMQMDLEKSRSTLENVWANTAASVDDRVMAAQMLAIQDWKFFKDYATASERVKQADALGEKRSITWQAMSRVARENGSYPVARDAAIKAVEAAENNSEKRVSQILLARAIHDQAMNELDLGEKPDKESLDDAHRLLTDVLTGEPGHPAASRLLLGISLMRCDGPSALKAWRYFFMIPENDSAPGLLAEPGQVLNQILPKWNGQILSTQDQESLVRAIAGSRFYEYTAMLAADLTKRPGYNITDNPAINEIILYAGFIKKIKQMTDEYYRQLAINNSKWKKSRLEKSYQGSLWKEAESFWNQLPFIGKKPEYNSNLFLAEISNRFGAQITMGSSGSYNGFVLFMGHRIMDDPIEVEQYGRKASNLRFIVLESMVSNGYSGWFLDGKSIPGGWGTESAIVWIREAYITELFNTWRSVADPQVMEGIEKRIVMETAGDDARARKNPYVFLPGLQQRLWFEGVKQVYTAMKEKGYKGKELCIAFVAEYLRQKLEFSIYAHEGRHCIDKIFYSDEFKKWTYEAEFRAKLSQIVFTSNPRLAIASGVISQDIGNNSQHGKANEIIMKTIVQWMEKHTGEIIGIETSRPMLPQFDLLSDDQIKAIFIEADPMAADTVGS
jgi:hypothetical protein